MPSGPPELHAKWCAKGPFVGFGDTNAQMYLKKAGYVLQPGFWWVKPTPEHQPTDEEREAAQYLIEEWDFDGIEGA